MSDELAKFKNLINNIHDYNSKCEKNNETIDTLKADLKKANLALYHASIAFSKIAHISTQDEIKEIARKSENECNDADVNIFYREEYLNLDRPCDNVDDARIHYGGARKKSKKVSSKGKKKRHSKKSK